MRRHYKAALIALTFLWGVLAVAIVWPVSDRLAGRRAANFQERVRRRWCREICRILGVRPEIVGTPHPDARLWVANHISWLDIVALGAQLPIVFVAKEEVAEWPVMGYLARRIGTLFVRRGDAAQTAAVAERMTWLLRQGHRLMLFPEGTTGNGERVLRFHAGLLRPAQWARVPVQAVGLAYLGEARTLAPFVGDDEFLPHLLRMLALDEIRLRVHYCPAPPLGWSDDKLARALRAQVVEALFPEREEPRRAADA